MRKTLSCQCASRAVICVSRHHKPLSSHESSFSSALPCPMPHIIAITRSITPNALYLFPFPPSNYDPFSLVAHFVLSRYLLPKNTHLAEAAAVGGWAGGPWELELNHMCASSATRHDRCCAHVTHTLQVGPGSCVERVLGGLSRKRRAAAAAAAWVVTFAPRAISHNPSMQCKSWSLSRAPTWSSGESKTFISRETPSQGSAIRCLMI